MFSTTKTLNSECHPQPRLTAFLACGENFMPMSWHMPVSKSPFRYAVAIRDENKTYDLVHMLEEFSINFIDSAYIEALETSGSMHGGDKFKETGLTPKKAEHIKSTLIEEAYMIYECKVTEVVNFGDHDVFVADVVCIHNKKVEDVSPTLFLGRGYYETTSKNPRRVERV
jgi:flavin reductase (DIM6/NTAB) family NADH-FMN oxidoreductase RutF